MCQGEERLQTIIETLPVGLWLLDHNGQILQGNNEARRIWGGSRCVGIDQYGEYKGWWLATGERIQPDQWAAARAVRRGETSLNEEIEIESFDGVRRFILNSAAPIRNALGEIVGAVVVNQDITHTKAAQSLLSRSLRKCQQNLQMLFDNLNDFLFILDTNGRILHVNPAMEKRLGYASGALVGMDITRVHPPERREEVLAILVEMPAGERTYHTIPFLARSGEEIPVETRVVPGKWNSRDAVFGVSRDVSERKQAVEEQLRLDLRLRQAQKAESLGRMAGAIAHHFNNLLAAVMGNIELAMSDLPEGAPPRASLGQAMTASKRMTEVSGLMLAYVGHSLGKREPVKISEILREYLPPAAAALPPKVRMNIELPPRGPLVRANSVQIKQVLTNILENAREAIGDSEGEITIGLTVVAASDIGLARFCPPDWEPKAPAYACIAASDTGCGMDSQTLEKAFDPFFSTKFTGRGLGLPVVLGLVKAHDGAITVESEPGRGATFRIFLPVLGQEDLGLLGEDSVAAERGIELRTVLLVDDDAMVRNMAQAMLKRLGYDVIAAAGGAEALDLFSRHKEEVCCVLLDLTMPGMDGWETLKELRTLRPNVPVVLASGYDKAHAMRSEYPEQPQVFLYKPFTLSELRAALAVALKE